MISSPAAALAATTSVRRVEKPPWRSSSLAVRMFLSEEWNTQAVITSPADGSARAMRCDRPGVAKPGLARTRKLLQFARAGAGQEPSLAAPGQIPLCVPMEEKREWERFSAGGQLC